jgi:pimeloyl-ACP methyl ester carboxylesterase
MDAQETISAQTDDETKIRAVALDYIAGVLENDPARMERSLHRALANRAYLPGPHGKPQRSEMSAILIDARGHGASDKPHDTAEYTRELEASDVISVLRDLQIECADYWGYSMGGQIGFAMAQFAPDSVHRLVIGGVAGAGSSRAGDRLLAALEARGAEAIPALWGMTLPATLHNRLLANDVEALKACRADSPGFAAMLPTIAMPSLLYAGSADPSCAAAETAAAKMPNASFFAVASRGHAEVMLHSELVLPRIVSFLTPH